MISPPQPGGRDRKRANRALAVLLVVVLAAFGSGAGSLHAHAQTPGGSAADIQLLRQPLFYGDDDRLDLRVRVVNQGSTPLDGFEVQTWVHPRIETRTALHANFDRAESFATGIHRRISSATLAPGEEAVIEVRPPLSVFPSVAVEGVYPMTITLFDAAVETELDRVTTQLIFYPEPVEVPLNMSLVVPIVPRPSRGPAGTFVRDNTENYALEAAVAADGWLRGILEGLRAGVDAGLRAGVAPSPRFVEELDAMADGYVRATDEGVETVEAEAPTATAAAGAMTLLQDLLQSERVQPLVSPYSAPDLPTLYDTLDLEHVISQLDKGGEVLDANLDGVSFDRRWLFAPGSRWDEQTLEQVRAVVGGLRTFVGSTFFEDPIDETTDSCPPSPPEVGDIFAGSFTCAVHIDVTGGPVPALVRDPDLQDRFSELAAGGDDAVDLQRLFAETAFVHLERPGVGDRVIHATLPSHWQPIPRTARRLFRGFARAPWLVTRTPDAAIDVSVARRPQAIVKNLPELRTKPDESYFDDIRASEDLLRAFGEIGPPDERIERLRRNLLVAESRLWWINDVETQTGREYALATRDEILTEFGKVTISGPDTTLTSQRSAIEVNVFNETSYPVTVDVEFEPSDPGDIRIDADDTTDLRDIKVEPGTAPVINVDAIAESSGIFQVRAKVVTPGETRTEINHESITIQSTNFNQIALGLTFGALGFLILFYVLRVIRRRRNPPGVAAESTSS